MENVNATQVLKELTAQFHIALITVLTMELVKIINVFAKKVSQELTVDTKNVPINATVMDFVVRVTAIVIKGF
jgi:hypothetical protein